jgi:hypothetical protein
MGMGMDEFLLAIIIDTSVISFAGKSVNNRLGFSPRRILVTTPG